MEGIASGSLSTPFCAVYHSVEVLMEPYSFDVCYSGVGGGKPTKMM